jgi:hypothetical protein
MIVMGSKELDSVITDMKKTTLESQKCPNSEEPLDLTVTKSNRIANNNSNS